MFGLVVTTEAHPAFSGARPLGLVARDEQSCIYYDSLHAAGICLGTIQARNAHAPLHWGPWVLLLTITFVTRWIHHNFDATACFDGCNNISEISER